MMHLMSTIEPRVNLQALATDVDLGTSTVLNSEMWTSFLSRLTPTGSLWLTIRHRIYGRKLNQWSRIWDLVSS